jgi:hypothetical protein
MFDDEVKCIIIADDDESECNNRISYLRSQRFCEKNAKMCREMCRVCEQHGDEGLKRDHTTITVEEFRKAF